MAKTINVAVLRLLWAPGPPVPDDQPHLQWTNDFFHELFQASNGWSIRDYWHRASLGLFQLEFDLSLAQWWRFGDHSHAELKDDRGGILAAARQLVEGDNGISLAAYDAVVAFVHSPPSNAGATPGGAVFDQAGSLAFYQHEVGHVLGFSHSFGPFIPPPNQFGSLYNDPYCVMGYTGTQGHVVPTPAQFVNMPMVNAGFWTSDRRPAAASLYRRFTGTEDFVNSGWFDHRNVGDRFWVAALTEVDNVTPVLAVIPVPASQTQVTIEYRTPVGDDLGVAPGVVVHSIGAHDVGAGRSEIRPPWFETLIPAVVGASATVLGLKLEVVTVSTGSPGGVEVVASAHPSRMHRLDGNTEHAHQAPVLSKEEAPVLEVPIERINKDGAHIRLGN